MCGLYIPDEDVLSLDDAEYSKILIDMDNFSVLESPPLPSVPSKSTTTPVSKLNREFENPIESETSISETSINEEESQDSKKVKKSSLRGEAFVMVLSLILCAAIGFLYLKGYFALVIHPKGEITLPKDQTVTATKVSVSGVTRNIIPGHYIWLVVDKDKYHQCWPKIPVSTPNKQFSEDIWEGGPPEEPYTLSLYAVDKQMNDRWLAWLDRKEYNGLPLP